jgi:hypothetical protein
MPPKLPRVAASIVAAGVLLTLAAACGGGTTPQATPTEEASADAEASLPDVFMTFEGLRYRLVGVESSAAPVQGEAVLAGVADDTDIDHEGSTQVYRATDGQEIYTFEANGEALEKRGVTLPDRCGRCGLRLDWTPSGAPGRD